MTNNPTIDGVSRELLQHAFNAVNYLSLRADDIGTLNVPVAEALRALLDAPAVERQESAKCGQCGSTSTDICNQNGCGFLESGNGEPEVAALQSTIAQLRIDLGNQTELTKQADYHASQRGKEIAQLQGRIAELESGRVEPVAYVLTRDGEVCYEADDGIVISNTPGDENNLYKWKPVYFNAVQPPVALVPDERAAFESYYQDRIMGNRTGVRFLRSNSGSYLDREVCEMWSGWQARACLDPTAALNTVHVGELDPAERLALARGEVLAPVGKRG